jgi:hypothetical protein
VCRRRRARRSSSSSPAAAQREGRAPACGPDVGAPPDRTWARSGPSAHRAHAATGPGLRFGTRPPQDRLESSQTKIISGGRASSWHRHTSKITNYGCRTRTYRYPKARHSAAWMHRPGVIPADAPVATRSLTGFRALTAFTTRPAAHGSTADSTRRSSEPPAAVRHGP